MNDLLMELQQLGMDVTGALERFVNNEALYVKFLKKFLDDPNMDALIKSISLHDYENALKYAHTLKGVTGNLGLTTLYLPLTDMVTCFRKENTEDIPQMMDSMASEYNTVCCILQKFE